MESQRPPQDPSGLKSEILADQVLRCDLFMAGLAVAEAWTPQKLSHRMIDLVGQSPTDELYVQNVNLLARACREETHAQAALAFEHMKHPEKLAFQLRLIQLFRVGMNLPGGRAGPPPRRPAWMLAPQDKSEPANVSKQASVTTAASGRKVDSAGIKGIKRIGRLAVGLASLVGVFCVVALLIYIAPTWDALVEKAAAVLFVVSIPFVGISAWVEWREQRKKKARADENHKRWLADAPARLAQKLAQEQLERERSDLEATKREATQKRLALQEAQWISHGHDAEYHDECARCRDEGDAQYEVEMAGLMARVDAQLAADCTDHRALPGRRLCQNCGAKVKS
jgi:hypothetical protein